MSTPSQEYRRVAHHRPPPLLKGLDAVVHGMIGWHARRAEQLRGLTRDADQVESFSAKFKEVGDAELRRALLEFRDAFRRGGRSSGAVLFAALAAVREASTRHLGLSPFHVQIMGAIALHRGWLAEMATGEGKTLTAGIAAVLAGWSGHPCHVVTVNDYLVGRDVEWLKPLHTFCGISTGMVTGSMNAQERRAGHACDVTYTSSKELLADFLRDRLHLGALQDPTRRLVRNLQRPARGGDGLVMRGLHTAIVDEADSVLIDEAVTPLIISTPHANLALREVVEIAQEVVSTLVQGDDYRVDARHREVELTPLGQSKLDEHCAPLRGIWRGTDRRQELVRQALSAREFFLRDKQYIVTDGKVIIVDEFTGRPMPGRSWRQGVHQAVEAKEKLTISDPSETIARLSFQRFFRLFDKLSGMTGTAREAAAELWQIYKLAVVRIPPNRPCIREHWPDRSFSNRSSKWNAIVEDIQRLQTSGRPILVGTRSVDASEALGRRLAELHLPFGLLNAVRHQEEAAIVIQAGQRGRITIATNMAGRGTDIKLGPGVARDGGLHVIATERHESGRVDRQLFGRSARQGDPGSAQAYVSAEDDLLVRHLPAPLVRAVQSALSAGIPAANRMTQSAVAFAQHRAQRAAFHQRKTVLRTDEWMDESLSFAGPAGA